MCFVSLSAGITEFCGSKLDEESNGHMTDIFVLHIDDISSKQQQC